MSKESYEAGNVSGVQTKTSYDNLPTFRQKPALCCLPFSSFCTHFQPREQTIFIPWPRLLLHECYKSHNLTAVKRDDSQSLAFLYHTRASRQNTPSITTIKWVRFSTVYSVLCLFTLA